MNRQQTDREHRYKYTGDNRIGETDQAVTHLDHSFDDTSVAIQGYNIYRRDRNAYGGGVAVYFQSHIPVMLREDLTSSVLEVLFFWGVAVGHQVLTVSIKNTCEMLDSVRDVNRRGLLSWGP